jgi:hypothetical protein
MMRTELAALQRDRETSVLSLKKPTANGNTYSRAGTAGLNPYSKTAKKFRKNTNIFYSSIFFHIDREENGIGDRVQQRIILKVQKPPGTFI